MDALATMALPKRNPRFVAEGFKTSFGRELPMPNASKSSIPTRVTPRNNDHVFLWAIQAGAIRIDLESGVVWLGYRGTSVPHPAKRVTDRGYLSCMIRSPWGDRPINVARCICHVANGAAPSVLHQVNHINGVKTDNRPCNLEWVTPSENSQHAVGAGLSRVMRGEENPRAKLSAMDVRDIRVLHDAGLMKTDIAGIFGVTLMTVKRIVDRETWKHVADASPDWASRVKKALGICE